MVTPPAPSPAVASTAANPPSPATVTSAPTPAPVAPAPAAETPAAASTLAPTDWRPATETPAAPPALPPPQIPLISAAVAGFKISGVRADENGGSVMIGKQLYVAGEEVDQVNHINFVGFENGKLIFRDARGALYTRRF